jgi:hypothetical protein
MMRRATGCGFLPEGGLAVPRRRKPHPSQQTFASVDVGGGWPIQPTTEAFMTLSPEVTQQTRRFERGLVSAGIAAENSAKTYRKALEATIKQAQRHLDRTLLHVEELFDEELIAALVADDRSLDGDGQLSAYTARQRRHVFLAYAQVMEVTPHDAI